MKMVGRSQSRKISMIEMAIKMKTDLHTLKKVSTITLFSLEFVSRIFTLYSRLKYFVILSFSLIVTVVV